MKKIGIAFLCYIISLSFLLSGCAVEESNWQDESYTDYEESEDFEYESFESDYEVLSKEIIEKKFKLNAKKITDFKDYVSSLSVAFDGFKDADIEKCLDIYANLKKESAPKSNGIIKNSKVDFDTLYSSIVKNSNANTDLYYEKIKDEAFLEKTVKYITDAINYQLGINPYINTHQLNSKLKALKVLYFDGFGYAFYNSKDNVIAINKELEYSESEYCQTITHETNHLMQDSIYKWDDKIENNMGFCYQFKDIELNYLYWTWYIEGAAQVNALNQLDLNSDDAFTYDSFVQDLEYLNSTVALLNENVNEFYYMANQNDIDIFFDLFNCKTKKDKIEIIKLMSVFQLLEEYDDIFSTFFYEKTNANEDINYEKRLIVYIARATSKIFYQNLARKIENKTVKLGDLFSLISSFESYLSKSCMYSSYEFKDFVGDFYNDYKYIQDEFFEIISEETGIEIEQFYKYYADFYHTTDHSEYRNSLLNKSQQEFYKKIYERKYFEIELTVNEAIKQFGS